MFSLHELFAAFWTHEPPPPYLSNRKFNKKIREWNGLIVSLIFFGNSCWYFIQNTISCYTLHIGVIRIKHDTARNLKFFSTPLGFTKAKCWHANTAIFSSYYFFHLKYYIGTYINMDIMLQFSKTRIDLRFFRFSDKSIHNSQFDEIESNLWINLILQFNSTYFCWILLEEMETFIHESQLTILKLNLATHEKQIEFLNQFDSWITIFKLRPLLHLVSEYSPTFFGAIKLELH